MHAVLLLPVFRLQAALRLSGDGEARPEQPLALTDGAERGGGAILETNAAARRAGVAPGLSAPQALARCAALKLLPRSPERERAAQGCLLQVAWSLCRDIEDTAPGVCALRLRLPPETDWPPLGWRAVELLQSLGLTARAGFADAGPETARVAAERARPVLAVKDAGAFMESLSLSPLRPPPAMAEVLEGWGIRSVKEFKALPRGALIDRLGPEAGRLHDLARGRETPRPLRLIAPPLEFTESHDFGYGVETLEPLLFILKRMLDHLCARLRAVRRVAGEAILILPLERKEEWRRVFAVPAPTADACALFRILHTRLETLRLEKRPEGVVLSLTPAAVSKDQFRLFETAIRDPNRLGETLARLAALAGAEETGTAERLDTHRPDVWRLSPPRFHRPRSGGRDAAFSPLAPPLTGLPLRRLRPPLPALVETDGEGRPVKVVCAIAAGRARAVLGPYRLSGAWWEAEEFWTRGEWDAELENGALLRLCRRAGGVWTVEGFYELPGSGPEPEREDGGRIIAFRPPSPPPESGGGGP